MENSNLDIWAIQKVREEINDALENVTSSIKNILFRNCLCTFRIESYDINVLFDTMLYAEDSDTLVLLMRNGSLTSQELKEELERRNIYYNEVIFDDNDFSYEADYNSKEIWFARESNVLEDAFRDSKEKGQKNATYYPAVEGILSIQYLTSTLETEKVDGRDFKGLIETEDKYILLVNQKDKKNIGMNEVLQVSEKFGIATDINMTKQVVSLENITKVLTK